MWCNCNNRERSNYKKNLCTCFSHLLKCQQREKPHAHSWKKHKKWASVGSYWSHMFLVLEKTVSCLQNTAKQPHSNWPWLLKDSLFLHREIICTCAMCGWQLLLGGWGLERWPWLAEQGKRSSHVFSQVYSHLLWLSYLNMSNRIERLDNASSYGPDINLCLRPARHVSVSIGQNLALI